MYIRLTSKAQKVFLKTFDSETDEKIGFISNYINLESAETLVFDSAIPDLRQNKFRVKAIVNFHRVNDFRYINKYFESINSSLGTDNLFAGCFESLDQRKQRLPIYQVPFIGIIYQFLEFLVMRVWPKIKGFNKLYFTITKGRNRVLTETEVLGRLVCCGFEILEYRVIEGLTYFIVKKVKEPAFDLHPSYGLLCKMQRVGKNGKLIGVYKFRTMHPYAEYLQDFVVRTNGYSEIGKPASDFRLTGWGQFMRRYWLDELPQLINVCKGEMNLVGVRPLSKRFLAEYPDDLKMKRIQYKPGCIPPYVALLKQEVSQYIESERIYFEEKEKHPLTTDAKFLLKAVRNIVTNKIKSA